ncbi:hypothetical protein [Pectinatus sottacetonis]|uniref:hypothetical protein n=1 Tax=Pectinatus sottacetonis TaxID=1002795 RepID=UPI0018C7D641|nr:hypothetical protein [Pectinatus sottacetonis]
MPTMIEAALKNGIIYGDNVTAEYVYMPASEIGIDPPICIFEKNNERDDISLSKAIELVRKLSLRPTRHPALGKSSC